MNRHETWAEYDEFRTTREHKTFAMEQIYIFKAIVKVELIFVYVLLLKVSFYQACKSRLNSIFIKI